MKLIGLDIGGSKIEGILWQNRKIIRVERIKTPKNRGDFLAATSELIRGLMGVKGVKGIGLAVAGVQDYRRGIILNSPNLKFLNGLALAAIVKRQFRVETRMDNDTNCFLLGESRFGQARGKKNIVALTLGTGVGGAVMVEGKLVRGFHGAAGELGHMIIAGLLTPALSSFQRRGRKGEEFLTVEDLVSSRGFQKTGLEKFGRFLGAALSNVVNIFDPELIILGGGVSHSAELFLSKALREMAKHTLLPKRLLPPVKISKLKHAGALGAVALFLE